MKIRTWEKWYWGIILSFLALFLIGVVKHEGEFKVETTVMGVKDTKYWSKSKVALYGTIFILVVSLILWLIIRFFVGDEKKKN